jgi:hypothetical protein
MLRVIPHTVITVLVVSRVSRKRYRAQAMRPTLVDEIPAAPLQASQASLQRAYLVERWKKVRIGQGAPRVLSGRGVCCIGLGCEEVATALMFSLCPCDCSYKNSWTRTTKTAVRKQPKTGGCPPRQPPTLPSWRARPFAC